MEDLFELKGDKFTLQISKSEMDKVIYLLYKLSIDYKIDLKMMENG